MMTMVLLLVGATFRVGTEKNLVGTFTTEEWGRHLFGIGAALTQSRFGIGGYVIDDPIEQKLQSEGLTGNPDMLRALGMRFPENLRDEQLMQNALERARDFPVPPPPHGDYQRLRGSVGDDVGIATYASLSFRLFGTTVAALYYTYFALLGAAIILFFLGHRRSPAALACLAPMILALYLLAISDLVDLGRNTGNDAGTIDIKDPRFFGTIAAIPALHLLLAWTRRDDALEKWGFAAIVGQALIFAFSLHMRWPLLWLLIALGGYWVARGARHAQWTFQRRTEAGRRPVRSLLAGALFVLIVGAGIVATNIAAHPLYRVDGDVLRHPFWHHMIGSLQANPDWARKYLPTVNGVTGDLMPAEIAKQEIAKLPPQQRSQHLMRINYPSPEAIAFFARKRFFDILLNDPFFVLQTYLVVNPKRIIGSVADFHLGLVRGLTASRAAVAIVALAVIVWAAAGDPEAPRLFGAIARVALVFSLIALAPAVIATPVRQIIMIDHFMWSLFFVCLLACWAGVHLVDRLRPRLPTDIAASR